MRTGGRAHFLSFGMPLVGTAFVHRRFRRISHESRCLSMLSVHFHVVVPFSLDNRVVIENQYSAEPVLRFYKHVARPNNSVAPRRQKEFSLQS